jgi:glycosyltransferase involved in cell wall biosynthesis
LSHGSFLGRNKNEGPIVSVIVPAYQEAEHIEGTLRGIVDAFRSAEVSSEILVVLDLVPGDETASLVRKVAKMYSEIRVLERQGRRGVGDALRTGIKEANGEIVVPVMGDGSEDPSDLLRLVKEAEESDIVFTDRFKQGRPPGYPLIKYVANRLCNFAVMLLFGIRYWDTTNAFKAYRKKLVDRLDLSSRGFEIFLELPVKAMMVGAPRTAEIEVLHIVRKKHMPKLSVIRDGYRYVRLLLCLLGR